jgi:glycyl-tRNA synthetase beta chain
MPELLLELGTEELPATAVHRAYTELGTRLTAFLEEAAVLGPGAEPVVMGTPRRLIVSFPDVASKQPDSEKEQRGPGVKAAFDSEGRPTPALLGFCKSQGTDPSQLRNDGQYVWFTKQIQGRETRDLLAEAIPKAIRALSFDKTMRWGSSRMRFARPIRWILASLGGELVPFEIEGVSSSLNSFGHRFYSPGAFPAGSLSDLLKGLRERHVEPDPAVRRRTILDQAAKVSAPGTPDLPDGLVDENTFLTEWPTAIGGEFSTDLLQLPAPVLVTAMAKHEKMFPVRDGDQKLTNRFVFVRNSGVDDSVRKGCEWVLNARFNDAKFFFEEDRKHSLGAFLEKTEGILFQEKLGTVRQRCDRLQALAPLVAPNPGGNSEAAFAAAAGLYSKADLSTGLVSELASLQGIIGGEYAKREGLPDPVCWAIATQYDLAKNPKPDCEGARTAVRLVIADQLDKLAGYLGIGLEPSGSSDPFALRRAASLLIEAALGWPERLRPYSEQFALALEQYADQGIDLDGARASLALCGLFASRYATLMPDVRYDVLQAAVIDESQPVATDPQGVRFRVRMLETLVEDRAFVQTTTRPMNIVIAAKKKGIEFGADSPLSRLEHSALESASGLELLEVLSSQQEALAAAAAGEQDEEAIRLLLNLRDPINKFFEETMVMVDEPEVRYARLTLMHATALQLLVAGDFTRIVQE